MRAEEESMKGEGRWGRRDVALSLASLAALLLGGCSAPDPGFVGGDDQDDEGRDPSPGPSPPAPASEAWANRVAQLALLGPVYSELEPGPWQGKEKAHVPTLRLDGKEVVVTLEHVMTAGSPSGGPDGGAAPAHYIGTVWLESDKGKLVALHELAPTAAAATYRVAVPKGVRRLRAFAWCNLHGVWRSAWLDVEG